MRIFTHRSTIKQVIFIRRKQLLVIGYYRLQRIYFVFLPILPTQFNSHNLTLYEIVNILVYFLLLLCRYGS